MSMNVCMYNTFTCDSWIIGGTCSSTKIGKHRKEQTSAHGKWIQIGKLPAEHLTRLIHVVCFIVIKKKKTKKLCLIDI